MGVRLAWDEEIGWAYANLRPSIDDVLLEAPVIPLHRVFADLDDVAAVTEGLAHRWRTPHGGYGAEWDRASQVRTAIEKFRRARATSLAAARPSSAVRRGGSYALEGFSCRRRAPGDGRGMWHG